MALKEDAVSLKTKLTESKAFWDQIAQADAERKKQNLEPEPLSAEQKEKIDAINKDVEDLSLKVSESRQYQEMQAKHEALSASLNQPVNRPEFADDTKTREENKSLGHKFAHSDEFKNWFKNIAPTGEISESFKVGESPAMEVKALVTGLSATSAGAMVRRDYASLVDFPFRPLTVRDVITIGRTGSDLIEFPRVVSYTSAAAATAEATATGTPGSWSASDSGYKPQSSMVLEKVTAAVKTIAHWIPATRRALADAAQIETLINAFLDNGLEIALETQIITGNGTGENFLGLDNTPNITLQPFVTDMLTTTRKARTAAMVVGRARSTAFVMNPYDWETLDLTKDAENRYYFGGPLSLGTKMLWGLPVVESEAVLQGTCYTGDLKQAILWDRERATIRISDSPGDFFLRNMVAILAELRAAFGVFRPPAIVRCDLHLGANS